MYLANNLSRLRKFPAEEVPKSANNDNRFIGKRVINENKGSVHSTEFHQAKQLGGGGSKDTEVKNELSVLPCCPLSHKNMMGMESTRYSTAQSGRGGKHSEEEAAGSSLCVCPKHLYNNSPVI